MELHTPGHKLLKFALFQLGSACTGSLHDCTFEISGVFSHRCFVIHQLNLSDLCVPMISCSSRPASNNLVALVALREWLVKKPDTPACFYMRETVLASVL